MTAFFAGVNFTTTNFYNASLAFGMFCRKSFQGTIYDEAILGMYHHHEISFESLYNDINLFILGVPYYQNIPQYLGAVKGYSP